MRKLAFFTLATYILILFAPLSFASSEVKISKACITGDILVFSQEEADALKSGSEKVYDPTYDAADARRTSFYADQAKKLTYDNSYCGKTRDDKGSYEKGDCSYGTETQFITEISEPIGGAVSSESTGGEGQVINLYKGICCHAGGPYPVTTDTSSTVYCDSTKVVYFDTYKNCSAGAQYCQKIQWLIAKSGAGIIKTYVKQIYVYGAGIVGFLAVAVIVGSGIQISLSGASGDITAAKDRIIQSLMGIALLFLSALILYTINPTFFNG